MVQVRFQLLQVAQLKCEDVSKSECIKLLTKKIREMTSDTRRLHLEYQMLMKYVGELTATCRSKEAAVLELQNQLRCPESTQHAAIPSAEQVCTRNPRLYVQCGKQCAMHQHTGELSNCARLRSGNNLCTPVSECLSCPFLLSAGISGQQHKSRSKKAPSLSFW